MGMTELYIHINGMGLAQYKIRVFTTWHIYYMNNVRRNLQWVSIFSTRLQSK